MATYREDGWVAEVLILEDASNGDWYHYKLRIVRTIQPPAFCKVPPNGDVFEVMQKKGVCFGGMWTLEK